MADETIAVVDIDTAIQPDFSMFDIDSFVDDSLKNSCTLYDDIFVSDFSPVQVPKSHEKSPFHESDSGVSEVSEMSGSISPNPETDMMLDEMLDSLQTNPFLVQSENDFGIHAVEDDLAGVEREPCHSARQTRSQTRIGGGVSRPDSSHGVNHFAPEKDAPGHKYTLRKPAASSTNRSSRYSNTSDESDDNDFETTHSVRDIATSAQKPKGSIRVKQAGSVLPSANPKSNTGITSVKVLRIVKPGNDTDSNTENEVVKALEERNRKNAEMARQNRLKKKAYVGNLEQEVEDSKKKIDELESMLSSVKDERDSYKEEVQYLKSVLANQSTLATLLKNIPNASGVTLSSSVRRKRIAELDHSYTPVKRQRTTEGSTARAGVCLHVDNDNVSLEFCRHCAQMASAQSL